MKTPCLVLMLAALAFTQCKKSGGASGAATNNSTTYYMRFDGNGTAVNYSSDPNATLSSISGIGLYSGALSTYSNIDNGAKNAVIITLFSKSAIAAGIPYNDPAKAQATNGDLEPQAEITWFDSTGVAWLTAGVLADANGNVPEPGVVANAKVTITDLTTTYVKGTFSGTVYRPDFAASKGITNGEFYLKRNQ